jgi:SAM-dependent methyltransferase
MFYSLRKAAGLLNFKEFALALEPCSLCGFRLQVRLCHEEMGVRCARCGTSAVTQSLAAIVKQQSGLNSALDVYELSTAGPLVKWLKARVRSLTTSEFFTDVPPGSMRGNILCQDVQRLTFPDASFDLCTSTEMFEHVEDDLAGFRETLRVLRPGGLLIFSVPLNPGQPTVERTTMPAGARMDILPREYHADRFRGKTVFCYRDYGHDLLGRLRGVGFADAKFAAPGRKLFGYGRTTVIARKHST